MGWIAIGSILLSTRGERGRVRNKKKIYEQKTKEKIEGRG
jgi:hypothetical protein